MSQESEEEERGKELAEIPWLLVRDDGAPSKSPVLFFTRGVPVLTLAERTRAAESRREREGCSGSIFSHSHETQLEHNKGEKRREEAFFSS